MSCNSCFGASAFTPEEIRTGVVEEGLLAIEIECSRMCNFRCRYCYIDEAPVHNELTMDEICDVILQAQGLGARRISILGGEPMLYSGIMELIQFINAHDMHAEICTNGTDVSEEIAKQLADAHVRVVLKIDSFNAEIQNDLAGNNRAYDIGQRAFTNLKRAGYPSADKYLAVSAVICQQNIEELPQMWKSLRDQNIEPYLGMLIPQDHADRDGAWEVPAQQVHELFETIAEMDRTVFNRTWTPQPPLVGHKCLRHQYSCLITSTGQVLPCVGVAISVGNISENTLADIIKESEVIQDLRQHPQDLKGPCGTCDEADHCYGCRGAAYQLTGDYMASDPLCWKNIDRQEEIIRLPVAVDQLIPQRPPMRLIDELISVEESKGTARMLVTEDSPFIDEKGCLDDVAFFEMVAQATAAYEGFHTNRFDDQRIQGFLLGAKKFEILGQAQVGDLLTVSACKKAEFGDFSIVCGVVQCGDKILAQGEIKLWSTSKINEE